mgnify:CR=1 FL=1
MKWMRLGLGILLAAGLGGAVAYGGPSAVIRSAPRVQFPGVVHGDADPQQPGDIDCSSPAHWDDGTMYMFYSTGHPFRSSGPNLFHLSWPSQRTTFDNEATWKMGARWIEATHKAEDGTLYMWYHNEPPLPGGRTAPRIGAMVSTDNGLSWRDLGIVLEAPAGSNNEESANYYFVGGNGDFTVIADREDEYFYFYISTYNKDTTEQGVAVARMRRQDRDDPVGKVHKWRKGAWAEPGLGGHVTPVFSIRTDWHESDADALWGPSIHWNTHLETWVMLLNQAKDKNWAQEGIYVSFNPNLGDPFGWTQPVKILDAADLEKSKWYPQVVGLDVAARETDKRAGRVARLFVAGLSKWEIVFLRPGEKAPSP